MAKVNSEAGHVMNKANFNELISVCTTMGPQYRPTREELQLGSLNSKQNLCTGALKEVADAEKTCKAAIGQRFMAFTGLGTISSRVINGLVSIKAPAHIIKQAKAWNRKLTGKRAGLREQPEEGAETDGMLTDKQISVSQMSFERLADHFSNLVELLKTVPEWVPNETDLTVSALETINGMLIVANKKVIDTYNVLTSSRIRRDEVMYDETSGLVAIARDAKMYLRSVFTVRSPEYKMVSGLQFKDCSI